MTKKPRPKSRFGGGSSDYLGAAIGAGAGAAIGPAVAKFCTNTSARAKRVVLAAAPMGIILGGALLGLTAMNGIMHGALRLAAKVPTQPISMD
jgi:hypothetical protein